MISDLSEASSKVRKFEGYLWIICCVLVILLSLVNSSLTADAVSPREERDAEHRVRYTESVSHALQDSHHLAGHQIHRQHAGPESEKCKSLRLINNNGRRSYRACSKGMEEKKEYSRYDTSVRDPPRSLETQLRQLRCRAARISAPLGPGQNALSKLRNEGTK